VDCDFGPDRGVDGYGRISGQVEPSQWSGGYALPSSLDGFRRSNDRGGFVIFFLRKRMGARHKHIRFIHRPDGDHDALRFPLLTSRFARPNFSTGRPDTTRECSGLKISQLCQCSAEREAYVRVEGINFQRFVDCHLPVATVAITVCTNGSFP
jgi:hypothetical protein